MLDVARAAGVSQATASYVLNGKDVPVSEATRQKVLAAARKLGYRPNRLAQNLARRRSGMIGAMVEYIDNPYYAEVAAKLNRKLHDLGYTIPFDVADHEDLSRGRALTDLLSWQPDALICYWHFYLNHYIPELVADRPVVFLGTGKLPPQYDCACSDLAPGAELAVRHLVELGHRRIMYLGVADDPRHDVAQQVCAESGLPAPTVVQEITTCPSRPTTRLGSSWAAGGARRR